MIKLSLRLKVIADYVSDDAYVVDVGCDHGLLDIYLVQRKKNIRVIASDVNENALNQARKNIDKYGLKNEIKVVVSDGLCHINDDRLDTIVIAGMGAHTIVGILYHDLKKLKNIHTLILQSNNDLDFLREKVVKIGYYIDDEELVQDNGIIYTVIVFKKGHRFYNKRNLYFGPILLKNGDSLFLEKLKRDLSKLEKFYPLIPKGHIHHRYVTYWKIKNIKKYLEK